MSLQFHTLLERLQEVDFYPHSVQSPIQVIHTHAAAIFLTGDYAYKIKKPVNFSFLDFSTLSQRKYFLAKELEINQPIVPDIYLEILPITYSDNQLILNGQGEIIDYILKMNQFPQNCLLINLFEAGTLSEFHIQELGKTVANFHAKTITNPSICNFGDIAKIKEAFDQNYEQTKKYIGLVQNQKQYDETINFTNQYFTQEKQLLKNRQIQNKIRECHGDLHLKNICFWHDKIQLFDRIEFNDSFRFVDTMYDVAFTIMDLDVKGRKDLSNIFLNIYLEQTGDWEGIQVLPLYLCRQAYVRAKVTSMLLEDPEISTSEKQQATQTAKKYYHLAWEYSQQHSGKIILMSGLSGSGKTTIAQYLAKKINAVHIRSDALRKHLAGVALKETGKSEIYTPQMNQKTYDNLLKLGLIAAKRGFNVILDAKFDLYYWREKAINLAQSESIPLKMIYCTAPLYVLRERLMQRTGDISDATAQLLEQQQATAEPFLSSEQEYLMLLDTTSDWQHQLDVDKF